LGSDKSAKEAAQQIARPMFGFLIQPVIKQSLTSRSCFFHRLWIFWFLFGPFAIPQTPFASPKSELKSVAKTLSFPI